MVDLFKFKKKGVLLCVMSLLSLSLPVSCSKEERENMIGAQESAIEGYLSGLDKNRIVNNHGVHRVVLKEGSGAPLSEGDSLIYDYVAKIFSNGPGTVFDTNIQSVAKTFGIDISVRNENFGKILYGHDDLIEGLMLGLDAVKSGEKCYILFSSPFGYDDLSFSGVPKNSPLIFEIEIKRIKKN